MINDEYKITIIGMGHLGLSIATYLAADINTYCIDSVKDKVDSINRGKSYIPEREVEGLLEMDHEQFHRIIATTDYNEALEDSDFVIMTVPTYDSINNKLNTKLLESEIKKVNRINPIVPIVIHSTVPVGFTEKMRKTFTNEFIYFPNFTKKNHYFKGLLHTDFLVYSEQTDRSELFDYIFRHTLFDFDCPTVFVDSRDLEVVGILNNKNILNLISVIS